MTDDEINQPMHWLDTLLEGGLPQVLAGPAGKAISRLIGSTADIPVAYLEGVARDIRDKSDARSAVSRAIAERVAEAAAQDPEVVDRALQSMVARSYRSQTNREAVAAVAVEDLQTTPPSPGTEGPSDDWMNRFERYAEDASSEDLRMMYGKLLASEIREPGKIAPTTVHFVSMLDTETAQLIERVLPVCSPDGVAMTAILHPKLSIPETTYIEQSGFWTAEKTFSMTFSEDGLIIRSFKNDSRGVALRGKPNSKLTVEAAVLSRAGRDLCNTVIRDFDYQAFADFALSKPEVDEVHLGQIQREKDTVELTSPIQLFPTRKESQ